MSTPPLLHVYLGEDEEDPTGDFKRALKAVMTEAGLGKFWITTAAEAANARQIDTPLLVCGKPTTEMLENEHLTLCPGTSIAQVLGTPHGLERLRRSVRLWEMLRTGTVEDPYYQYELVDPSDTFKGSPAGYQSKMRHYFQQMPHNALYVDIETSGDIRTDEPEDTELLSVAVLFPSRDNSDYKIAVWTREALADEYCRIRLAEILCAGVPLALHNQQFDVKWKNNRLKTELQGRVVKGSIDTLLKHAAMFPGATGDHSLKPLAQKLLGAPEWEKEIKKYTIAGAHYERIPPNLLYSYNAADVYWTWKLDQLFDTWLAEGPEGPRKLLRDTVMPASRMLVDIESTDAGWPVDIPHLEKLEADLLKQAHKDLVKFRMAVGNPALYISEAHAKQRAAWLTKGTPLREYHEFNPKSPMQIAAYLTMHGADLPRNKPTKTNVEGSLKTDEETLLEYLKTGNPPRKVEKFISRLLKYRHTTKMCSNYATGVLKKQRGGRVRPRWSLLTVTGRLSSWIHTVPRPEGPDAVYRQAFITDEGESLIHVDYGQIETRIVAELCGDPQMIDDLQEGRPDFFAVLMPGCFPNLFRNLGDVWKMKDSDPQTYKALRNQVKPISHGANYMRQAPAMAKQLNIPVKDAYRMFNSYMGRYPLLKAWQDETMAYVNGTKVDPLWGVHGLWTSFGRRFQQGVITDKNEWKIKNEAIAFKPQSIGSDICLTAAINLHESLHLYGARIVNSHHDAIDVIAPTTQAAHVLSHMQTTMQKTAAETFTRVPFLCAGAIGENWAEVSG